MARPKRNDARLNTIMVPGAMLAAMHDFQKYRDVTQGELVRAALEAYLTAEGYPPSLRNPLRTTAQSVAHPT